MSRLYVKVAVPVAHGESVLTYAVPDRLAATARPGCRVHVVVGRQRLIGVILEAAAAFAADRVRLLEEVLDDEPVLTEGQIALSQFVADYYFAPLGQVIRLCLPPDTGRKVKRILTLSEKGSRAQVFGTGMGLTKSEHELLMRFAPGERKTISQLRKGGVPLARIQRLLDDGYMFESQKAAPPKARADERVEVLEGGEPIDGRAHALIALDAFLRAAPGTLYVADLKLAFKSPRGKLARLEKLGRLRIVSEAKGPRSRRGGLDPARPKTLNDAQRRAKAAILSAARGAFLLEGVTGSGKTEVYLQVLLDVLARGKGALFVVPEISLTPQLFARVHAATEGDIALLHSSLSVAERRDALTRLRQGTCRVALGARSALFAPVPDLGLIVVDEEHDGSLKQDESPRYHGRDVALWRAAQEGALCVLGSATPSLETRENVRRGKVTALRLPHRATGGGLPSVTLIDLRKRKQDRTLKAQDRAADTLPGVVLSDPLKKAVARTLEQGEQALLFVNRRGYATVVFCEMCGHIGHCPQCSVTLTMHQHKKVLLCHQCGHQERLGFSCPVCRSQMVPLGLGTERVESEVQSHFPGARVARMDRDTVKSTRQMREVLQRVQQREVDILIGTQMVAKGHDFPGISLVGVVLADVALSMPDFRASERTFALLTQVAGRAGRGTEPGQVLIQTFQPGHIAIQCAVDHDTDGFIAQELLEREATFFPPASRIALLRISAEDEAVAFAWADAVGRRLSTAAARLEPQSRWDLLGPAAAPLERLRGMYRVHLYLRTAAASVRHGILSALMDDTGFQADLRRAGARLVLDVDPTSVL